ncbi:MAG: hypothetical protein WC875_00510 [Candidatus Absconditabacterales bacterium]
MMVKNFIHGLFYTFLGFTALTFSTFALVVEVPPHQGQEDVIVTGPTQIQSDEGTFFETIQIINRYLRFTVGVVCMGVLVYGGFSLITAQGDEAKMKKSSKLLLGSLTGILIAILSYALIRLIVNLIA